MTKLTIAISAFNEEKKIADCLDSVKDLADEIIFVDNSSNDKTVEIAQKYTSKIFTRPNNLMLNVNKNFGFSKATGDWILSLDADERVTPELTKEIKEVLANGKSQTAGYWIPRKNMIFGKWVKHTGWYPDVQMRLFRKGKGKFEERHVHEMIQVDGKAEYLKERLLHYNYDSINQFLYKHVIIYAPNEAQELLRKGYVFRWQDVIAFPLKEFMNRFFAREGYKDGFLGLLLSVGMAFYHFIIFAYVWEKKGFPNIEDADFLTETEAEFARRNKEMKAWFINEKVKTVKNIIAKIKLKIAGKF